MNTVKAITPQTETQATIPRAKTKQQAGGDFIEMLSGAMAAEKMKNAASKPENVATKPENTAKAANKVVEGEPGRPLRDKAPADVNDARTEEQDAAPDETAIVNAAVQMQVQAPVFTDIFPDVTDVPDMTGAISVQAEEQPARAMPQVQATAAQTVQVQPTPELQAQAGQVRPEAEVQSQTGQVRPEAEPQVRDAQIQDRQIREQTAGGQTVHTQTENRQPPVQAVNAEQQPIQAAQVPRKRENAQERTEVQNMPEQAVHAVRTVQAQQRPASGEEAGDIVFEESARQPGEDFQAQTARRAIRQVNAEARQAAEPEQARFDGMIAKARQELTQAKAVPGREQPVADMETKPAVDDEPKISATPEPDAVSEPEDAIPEKGEAVRQEAETKPAEVKHEVKPAEAKREIRQTESVRTHVPEIREQKPEKPERPERKVKYEEADANAVQPKAQHISAPERPHMERQAPAQAAKTPDQFEQIRAQVVRNLEDRKMEFNMQLHPQELGKIDVKMILEGGKLAVEIIAANAKSAEILHKQTEALVSSLRVGNLEVASVNVVTASQSASGSMDGQYNRDSFNGQAGRQDGQSSKAGSDGRSGRGETAGRPEDEAAATERQPRGILNYSI